MTKASKTMIEINHSTNRMSVYYVYQQPSERGYTSPVKTFSLTGNPAPIQKVIDEMITIWNETK